MFSLLDRSVAAGRKRRGRWVGGLVPRSWCPLLGCLPCSGRASSPADDWPADGRVAPPTIAPPRGTGPRAADRGACRRAGLPLPSSSVPLYCTPRKPYAAGAHRGAPASAGIASMACGAVGQPGPRIHTASRHEGRGGDGARGSLSSHGRSGWRPRRAVPPRAKRLPARRAGRPWATWLDITARRSYGARRDDRRARARADRAHGGAWVAS